MDQKTQSSTDFAKKELLMSRTFDAPRELVFDAWSDCDELRHWWGPREWPMTKCTIDFRPGGAWLYCLTGPEGEEAWGKGVYTEIVKPERIVYDDYFTDSEGNPAEDRPSMTVSMEFLDRGGKTELRGTTRFATEDDLRSVLEMGVVEGMTSSLDRLEERLAAQTAKAS